MMIVATGAFAMTLALTAGDPELPDTAIGDAVANCREELEWVVNDVLSTPGGDTSFDATDDHEQSVHVTDDGHTVLIVVWESPDAVFAPSAPGCLYDELDLPEWAQLVLSWDDSGDLDVGDHTIRWRRWIAAEDAENVSRFLIYDREVGGGRG